MGMAKEDKESPADRIAREKAEKLAAQQKADEEAERKQAEEAGRKQAEEDAAAAENDDEMSDEDIAAMEAYENNGNPVAEASVTVNRTARQALDERRSRANAAAEKLRLIAMSYPNTTPDEHTIFGFGGRVFHLGDLRAIFGVPGPRG